MFTTKTVVCLVGLTGGLMSIIAAYAASEAYQKGRNDKNQEMVNIINEQQKMLKILVDGK